MNIYSPFIYNQAVTAIVSGMFVFVTTVYEEAEPNDPSRVHTQLQENHDVRTDPQRDDTELYWKDIREKEASHNTISTSPWFQTWWWHHCCSPIIFVVTFLCDHMLWKHWKNVGIDGDSVNCLWHRWNKVLETFLSIAELLQICQLHTRDVNLLFHCIHRCWDLVTVEAVWVQWSEVVWVTVALLSAWRSLALLQQGELPLSGKSVGKS